MFQEYYQPTSEEFDDLWKNGLIVLDTNVLLGFFRYSATTRDDFLAFLEKERDRIWIPNHVGLEFHRRYLSVTNDQENMLTNVRKSINQSESTIAKSIDDLRHYPKQIADELSTVLTKSMKRLRKKTDSILDRHETAVISEDARQRTLERITDLYNNHVGEPYSEEELADIETVGKDRYVKKIPPGYKDVSKDDNQYGDLIVWRQMLDKAKTDNLPMIFVTADVKEDWWWQVGGRKVGARPELIKEYYEASNGKRIHFYQPTRFLEFAKQKGESISDTTVEEIEGLSSHSDDDRQTDDSRIPFRGDVDSFIKNINKVQSQYGSRLGLSRSVNDMIDASSWANAISKMSAVLEPTLSRQSASLESFIENRPDLFSNIAKLGQDQTFTELGGIYSGPNGVSDETCDDSNEEDQDTE